MTKKVSECMIRSEPLCAMVFLKESVVEKLRKLLQTGRNGNAVLFCGAGLTADCLNFSDDSTLGVTSHLLDLLNIKLKENGKKSGFKDIKNASKQFRMDLGNYRLMNLLKDRFDLNKVSASIVDIVSYPWSAIYTTNYDKGLEIALRESGKKCSSVNNIESPNAIYVGTPVVHLHGFTDAWTLDIFERSCILDADSYHKLHGVKEWLGKLRFDIERAEVVVFIGFSAADFHLADVFFNASGLKEKAFFINRPSSDPDLDERAIQEDFGEPLYIGREEFAQVITETLHQDIPLDPKLASFVRYKVSEASKSVPPVQDIEDLFIWGKFIVEHLKRDHDLLVSDYHVLRPQVGEICKHLSEGGNSVFLHGDICDGKSLVVLGAVNKISSGKPVFELRHAYSDLLIESASILMTYPNAVFVVDNCFSLREDRLLGLARQVSASEGGLILSARSISTEAESSKLKGLRSIKSLLEIGVGRLQSQEIDAFIALIDQIAGWRNFHALSSSERKHFIEVDCKGVIPSVLLRLLESSYVKNKYKEEYNKISYSDERNHQMVIATLLISSIGCEVGSSLISDIFERDFDSALRQISSHNGGIKLVRMDGGIVRTIPSIGARNLLRSVVDSRDVVNTTIYILEKMSDEFRRTDLQQYIFGQLMRYSILSSTVSEESEINRFFDHISKISYFREMPLFWLQWHMAMCAQDKWLKAEEYLDMGYTSASAYEKKKGEKYNKKQLDDRRAKFLIARADSMMRSGAELFRDVKEALDLVGRIIRGHEITHHPYETLLNIFNLLQSRGTAMIKPQLDIVLAQMTGVIDQARIKLGHIPEGYQRRHATECVNLIDVETLVK